MVKTLDTTISKYQTLKIWKNMVKAAGWKVAQQPAWIVLVEPAETNNRAKNFLLKSGKSKYL